MIEPTPTQDLIIKRRLADFPTLVDALEYAAKGERGFNFYSSRGQLQVAATFTEIRDRARAIGHKLVGLGIEPQARIALIAETSADFVCFFMGCQYASVLPVPMPLPTSFGGRDGYVQQLSRQLETCQASGVITPDSMKEIVDEASKDYNLKFVSSLDSFMEIDAPDGDHHLPETDDLSYLQYSSGSTRFPHGIAITHKSLMSNCHGNGNYGMGLRDDDRCISWLPFYHDMGLVGTVLTPIACQMTVDFLSTEDFARRPMMWLSLMSRNKGTMTYSPTFGYDICARRVGQNAMSELDLSSWRVAGIGGDMIRPDVMRNFAETFEGVGFEPETFCPSYGLAECTLAVSFMPLNTGILTDWIDERVLSGDISGPETANPINGHIISGSATNGDARQHPNVRYREVVNCGVPLPEYDLEIRGGNGQVFNDKEIGNVFVKGESVMQGYFNDIEATKACLSDDGWLNTGDMGYMNDGSLFIIGRIKDMIIVNGRNHWPQDIEWAAEQLPGIRNGDIAAVSLPGDKDEEVPAVLVHCRLRDEAERLSFMDDIRSKILQDTGIQVRIELLPPRSLPRTSSGKLSRAKARAQFLAGGLQAIPV